jgi:competence protein ComEA
MFKKLIVAMVLFSFALWGMSLSQLNKASKEDLMKIKGIGEKKAELIIKERKKKPFKSFDDLEKVKGIGPALVENIKKDVLNKDAGSSRKSTTSSSKNKNKGKTKKGKNK